MSRSSGLSGVVGVGFRSGAGTRALLEAIDAARAGRAAVALATPAPKADAPALRAAARALGLEVCAVDAAALRAADPGCLTRSQASMAAFGVGSVAEASALAAAGPAARLLGPRVASADGAATAAFAFVERP